MFQKLTDWIRAIRHRFSGVCGPAIDVEGALHDLRHQLNRSRELMSRWADESDPDARQQIVEKIGRCISRASLLADSAMLGSRIKTTRLSPVSCSINEIAQEVIDELTPLASCSGVKLKSELSAGIPQVNVDPSVFPSVISNLLDNGVRYSGSGGEVIVTTGSDGTTVILEVHDNGPGIPESDRLRIFERNFRGSTSNGVSGSGIGLFLVNEIVNRHHGQVSLRRGRDGGTVFSISLPAAANSELN